MIILGLNCFHGDAAACLVRDGVLIAAAEEERFRRGKHWAGFPTEAIKYCLAEAGITINDVDRIALNQDNRANLAAKLKYLFRSRPKLSTVLERARNRIARETTTSLLRKCFPDAIRLPKIDRVEHHLAHLSSAFHVSPFDEAVVVSIDGEAHPLSARGRCCFRIRSAFSTRRSPSILASLTTEMSTR